jgi:hypothetical protein
MMKKWQQSPLPPSHRTILSYFAGEIRPHNHSSEKLRPDPLQEIDPFFVVHFPKITGIRGGKVLNAASHAAAPA